MISEAFVPVFVSTLDGTRFGKIMENVEMVLKNSKTRISTGVLNEILQDAMATTEPPTHAGRRLKIKYMTQVDVSPPSFAIFVNDEKLLHFSYKRYLENCLRRAKDFKGTPIRFLVRQTNKEE